MINLYLEREATKKLLKWLTYAVKDSGEAEEIIFVFYTLSIPLVF